MQQKKANKQPILKIHNLKTMLNKKWIHRSINLEVYKNEMFVILGESGEGKSVLLKIIMGFIQPLSGSIFLRNSDLLSIKKKDASMVRKKIGILFQGKTLFDSMNIYENIAFGLKHPYQIGTEASIKEKVYYFLNQVGLKKDILNFSPSQLSEGVQKRVSLARILMKDPELMLYDEPTTGLDPITCNIINKLMLKLQKENNITSIVVTHDIKSTFHIADRMMFLHDGIILSTGTRKKIFHHRNQYIQKFLKDFKEFYYNIKIPSDAANNVENFKQESP